MNKAAAETIDYQEWLALHTSYCKRLAANITLATCQSNQRLSAAATGDLRCVDCGGLHDQAQPAHLRLVVTSASDREDGFDDDGGADPRGDDENTDEVSSAHATIIDHETENPEEFDPLTRALIAELQGYLKEDDAPEPEPARAEVKEMPERHRRVRVFTGRCYRCAGYMVHGAKECHEGVVDDEVYRCFNCGERISPAYDFNRKFPGTGWQ